MTKSGIHKALAPAHSPQRASLPRLPLPLDEFESSVGKTESLITAYPLRTLITQSTPAIDEFMNTVLPMLKAAGRAESREHSRIAALVKKGADRISPDDRRQFLELTKKLKEHETTVASLEFRLNEICQWRISPQFSVKVFTAKVERELLAATLGDLRERFWRALYEIPHARDLALQLLSKVARGEKAPWDVLLERKSSGVTLPGAVRWAKLNCATIAKVLDRDTAPHADRKLIAKLLLELSPDPEESERIFFSVQDQVSALMECRLKAEEARISRDADALVGLQTFSSALCRNLGAATPEALLEGNERLEQYYDEYRSLLGYCAEANRPLVKLIALKYRFQGLDLPDLEQEGMNGVMRALDKCDRGLGLKFSTYVSYWIKQSIRRALDDKGRTVRVPAWLSGDITALKREQEHFYHKSRSFLPPTAEELASRLKWELKRVNAALPYMNLVTNYVETSDSEETRRPVLDRISPLSTSNPGMSRSDHAQLSAKLDVLLKELKHRERTVLRLRFGIGDGYEYTLEEVSQILHVSRERVRQIESRGIILLRLKMARLSGFAEAHEDVAELIKAAQHQHTHANGRFKVTLRKKSTAAVKGKK